MPSAAPSPSPRPFHSQEAQSWQNHDNGSPKVQSQRLEHRYKPRQKAGCHSATQPQVSREQPGSDGPLTENVHDVNSHTQAMPGEEGNRREELHKLPQKSPDPAAQPTRSLRPRTKRGQAVTASSVTRREHPSPSREASPDTPPDAVRISITSNLDSSHVSLAITRPGIEGETPVPTAVLVHALRLSYEHIISSATNTSSDQQGQLLSGSADTQQPGSSRPPTSFTSSDVHGAVSGPSNIDLERLQSIRRGHRVSMQETKSPADSSKTLIRSLSFNELATRARAAAEARAGLSPNKRPRNDEIPVSGRRRGATYSAGTLDSSSTFVAPTVPTERPPRPRASSAAEPTPQDDAALAAALHQRLSQAGFGTMTDGDRQKLLVGTILAQHRVAADRLGVVETQRDQLQEQLNGERASHAQAAATWSDLRLRLTNQLQELRLENEKTLSELNQLRSQVYLQGVDLASTLGSNRVSVADAQTSPTNAGSFDTLLPRSDDFMGRPSSGGGGSAAHSASSTSLQGGEVDLAVAVQAAACAWENFPWRGSSGPASFPDPPWPFAAAPASGDASASVMAMDQDLSMVGQGSFDRRCSLGQGAHVPPLASSPAGLSAPSNGFTSNGTDTADAATAAATAAFAAGATTNLHSSSSSSSNGVTMPPPAAPA